MLLTDLPIIEKSTEVEEPTLKKVVNKSQIAFTYNFFLRGQTYRVMVDRRKNFTVYRENDPKPIFLHYTNLRKSMSINGFHPFLGDRDFGLKVQSEFRKVLYRVSSSEGQSIREFENEIFKGV